MKKKLIDAGILAAVFILAVIIFSYITNQGNDNMTADMGSATYPQISFSDNGYTINSIPGYKEKMDILAIRDTITPVTNGQLLLNLKSYENEIKSLSYTVYSLDGEDKLLEDTVKKPGEVVTLAFDAEGLSDGERVLEITLDTGKKKPVYFYTRIVDSADKNVLSYMDYASAFHENALDKVEGAGIGKAIEPTEEGDNTTFRHVTIHSDYNHVTWGELEPSVEGPERWSIKELNGNSMSVQLEYSVRCKGEENETDVYKVREFFRLRYASASKTMYLLDYDRTMDQILDPARQVLSEKGVLLGIAGYDTPYLVNEDGTIAAFVQADELWNYNRNSDEISLVFSFSSAENMDERNLTSQHEIHLLEMDGKGNVTFAVYGYMNRGEHEGEVGVAVYYYNIETSSVEERVFISTDKSYGNAVNELGKLVYYSVDRDMLYTMVDGTLYETNVGKNQKSTLVEGLKENQYVVSSDGHMVAWQNQKEEQTKLRVMNLDSGKERTVECKKDEALTPLGFIENDFVYGVARTEDTGQSASGITVLPMYKVEIQNSKSKVIKTYQTDGIYILSAEFADKMITLNRATKAGSIYTGTAEDYITNNEGKEESNIYLESYTTELKETQVRLIYNDGIEDKKPKILKPKLTIDEKPVIISFDDQKQTGKYYVYGYGEMQGIYDSAGEAIVQADACGGVVTNEKQQYIWERGNRDLQYSLSDMDAELESIRSDLASGMKPLEIMERRSPGESMDLTGCTTEELLYIINQNKPVIAMLDASNPVILTGYGDKMVTYIDVASGERRSVTHAQMDEMTQGSGHTYIG